jgi:two-component system phosphate regulon sensor histidine kinase PhoR
VALLRPGRFFWKLFLGELDSAYLQDLTNQLRSQAETIRGEIADRFDAAHAVELNRAVREAARLVPGLRITMIAADGTVWADSDAEPSRMEPHGNRQEVADALRHGWGESLRMSRTVDRELKYVAVRVGDAERPLGVIRVSMPERGMALHTAATRRLLWKIGAIGLAAALVLALGLAAVWSAPIRRITETARTLSKGDLTARVRVTGRDELAEMARSLNQMRDNLAAQLRTIDRQRQDLEHLIRTLQEGVIVADGQGRIMVINPAAERLLGLIGSADPAAGGNGSAGSGRPENKSGLAGRHVRECVPNSDLQEMLLPGSGNGRPAGGNIGAGRVAERGVLETRLEFDLPGGAEIWAARATRIAPASTTPPGEGEPPARLVVLTDITELTRTVQMKTDFVANASHELRTPLSAIRASVETLQQIDLSREASSAAQFIDVIERQSARLVELVADLLDLSRLESPAARFPPEPIDMAAFLAELHARHAADIEAAGLDWQVQCAADTERLSASPQLLRLVLDNLVDNAVKFTDRGGFVRVSCQAASQEVCIEVEDSGCGIPEEQQSRVFERFYQVQRSRSGQGRDAARRGTGLGLSIVRHAVSIMRGTVRLCSRTGEGTRVTVVIPRSA